MKIIKQAAVHHDERVFDNVGGAVLFRVVERVGVARAAAESGLLSVAKRIVISDAARLPHMLGLCSVAQIVLPAMRDG